MKKNHFLLLFCLLFAETKILHHDLEIHLNPQSHEIVATDEMTISSDEMVEFLLSAKLEISNVDVNEKSARIKKMPFTDESEWMHEKFVKYRIYEPLYKRMFGEKSAEKIVKITYSGVMFQDANSASFSREKIAMEIDATISKDGVFLSPSAGYYPMADEDLLTFHSTINLPNEWSAVSEGNLIQQENGISEFLTEHLVDGMFITAAIWDVQKKVVDGIEFYTYFFPEDAELAQNYLDMSVRYVQMYSEMLSPYPFSKFAVVENFFPTGYGMPSYTVLGRSVIHLPFIVYTSLGDEVLHNWWGNSVYVGEGGNWCEGLTSYQADYLYKLQKSDNDAKQYRKNLLKDYTVYATNETDFAPSEFTSRTNMSSRAIGYGKVAMIFHMIEEHLGHDKFIAALKLVIERHQWTKTGYAEFFSIFEEVSGEDLSIFKQKWIDEKGNPKLELVVENGEVFIKQPVAIKPMWIDIEETTDKGQMSYSVFSNSISTKIPIAHPFNNQQTIKLVVDPNFDLMRSLDKSEIDPTLRSILKQDAMSFVVPSLTEDWQNLAQNFASAINSDAEFEAILDDNSARFSAKIYLGVLPKEQKIDACETITENNALVWAFRHDDDSHGLVIFSENIEQLSPLARKLPHYGKYGYLIFENGKNIAKGNHETENSPLILNVEHRKKSE